MRRGLIALVTAGVLGSASPCLADVISQFGPSGLASAQVTADLVTLGIPADAASETTATSFLVPGGLGTNTTLTFNFLGDTGGFQFTFGYFDLNAVSAAPTSQQAFATQALSNATVVFDDLVHDPGASATLVAPAGANLGFFLIPNNTLANFLANPGFFDYTSSTPGIVVNPAVCFSGSGVPPCFPNRAPLFSISDANPGQFDQMLSFVGGGQTMFAFEDLTRVPQPPLSALLDGFASDANFHDLVFSIDSQLQPAPTTAVPEPASIVLLGSGLLGIARSVQRRRRRGAQS